MAGLQALIVPLLLFSTALSVGLIVVARQSREESGVREFTFLMLAAAIWSGAHALQFAAGDLRWMLLWRTVGYVGHNLVPVGFLVFMLTYTGSSEWVTRRTVALLAAEPLFVAVVLTPTNPLHHLIYAEVGVEQVGSLAILARSFGPWYWVNTTYNYLLVTAGLVLCLRMALGSRQHYRRQGTALLAGAVPAFAANVAWVLGLTPIDYTPLTLGFLGVVWGIALFRYRLLDLVPVARDTVLDNIRDGYMVLDDQFRIVDLNPAARDVLDDPDDALGTPVVEAFPACVDFLDRTDSEAEIRDEIVVEDGDSKRYFDAELTTLRDARITGRLLLLRDITGRRSVEQWYRTLTEQSTDIVTVTDAEGRISYQSPSAERVLGYDAADLVGTPLVELVHPDDRMAVQERFPDWGSSEEAAVEYRIEAADGTWRWIESRGRNLLDDPTVGGIVVNSREITERKHHEQDLERKNDRLDRFATLVSHDLRNPLTVIDGRLEFAEETGDPEHFAAISTAVERMERLIDDMLTLARKGAVVGDPASVDPVPIVQDAWAHTGTADATIDLEPLPDTVVADPDRLRELFENLFRNAVEHGGPDVTVAVGTVEACADAPGTPPGTTGLYVADDGPGLPDDADVFEHGFTTSDGGTGFGLSIVADIVDAHGWTITGTECEDLEGARFEITGIETTRETAATGDTTNPESEPSHSG
ncbi:PAS domain S-box-containing protein [Halorientalis persicus]|uniref:histidine kinase n=1 Tax=Halorientalis persicus TaxID=1367881 RepID=A0A1H8RCG3_9EURY|nr:histidine kinase N-terminal 7TM domain-containing protein [Halorientalis persicus]SEO64145.1 PAS domain S-box-containing protein [Halorientalis persicus]